MRKNFLLMTLGFWLTTSACAATATVCPASVICDNNTLASCHADNSFFKVRVYDPAAKVSPGTHDFNGAFGTSVASPEYPAECSYADPANNDILVTAVYPRITFPQLNGPSNWMPMSGVKNAYHCSPPSTACPYLIKN